jgi:sugar/nucleoside kinase (ribokinase family)
VTRVVVVGDALLDVVARPSGPMRPGADVLAEIRIGTGGQGANLAVRLARLGGLTVELVCGLGGDPAAAIVLDALEADGVTVSPVTVDATGTVVILIDADGERSMLSQRAAFAAAAEARIQRDADWMVVSGYLLLEPDAPALARSLAARPGRRVLVGCTVPGDPAAWVAAAFALAPALTVLNRDEAAALSATPGFAGGGLVITDAEGAAATIDGVTAEVRRPDGEPAVDTTGAGDAFAAGLIASLAREAWPPSEAELERALAAAAELASAVARTPGAQGRIPAEAARPRA